MVSIEIRVLSPASIEDYHGHLLRLDLADRRLRFANEADDRGIDGHCLRLLGAQAIVIGGYVEGVLRAGLEILPDRTARRANAVFTAEPKFSLESVTRMLLTRLFDEARRYHLAEISLHGFDDAALLTRVAQSDGIEIAPGMSALLKLETPAAAMVAAAPQPGLAYA
jgi:hypothetical protein